MACKRKSNFAGTGRTLSGRVVKPRLTKAESNGDDDYVNESNHIEPSDSESEAEMDDEEVAKEIQKELDFHRKFPNYKIIRDPSLPGVWKNLASGMTRFTDVIKRAAADVNLPETEKPIIESNQAKFCLPSEDTALIECKNGLWIHSDSPDDVDDGPDGEKKKKASKHMTMTSAEQLASLGDKNECSCSICSKQKDFENSLKADLAIAGKLRSEKSFKRSEGRTLGEMGEIGGDEL